MASSPDRRFVAFDSGSSDLVDGDTNDERDVFVRWLHRSDGSTVGLSGGGAPMCRAPGGARVPTVSPTADVTSAPDPTVDLDHRIEAAERELHDTLRALSDLHAERAVRAAAGPDAEPVTSIHRVGTVEEVREQLAEIAFFARSTVRAVQPTAHPATPAPRAHALDRRSLRRGVRMQVVHDLGALSDPMGLAALRRLGAGGIEVRCRDGPLQRLVIVDGTVAVVPGDGGGALVVRHPGLVRGLVELFDGQWAGATPLPADDVPTGPERALLALLAQGCTDQAAARAVGLSERHVRRLTAHLMDRLGARSRFAAGVEAARRGWI